MFLASLEPTEMEPYDWGLDKVFGPKEEAVIKYFSPGMELPEPEPRKNTKYCGWEGGEVF